MASPCTTIITRGVLETSEFMLGLTTGSGAYSFDNNKLTAVEITKAGSPLIFYEVALAEGGSWWLPVTTEPDRQWGDWIALSANGMITTSNLLRPENTFCWVPEGILETIVEPVEIYGTVNGEFPEAAPSGSS